MTKSEPTLTKVRFEDVRIEEVGDGAFIVCLGRDWFHEGPKDYLFFTREEAVRLQDRVRRLGFVNLDHWNTLHSQDDLEERWFADWQEERLVAGY